MTGSNLLQYLKVGIGLPLFVNGTLLSSRFTEMYYGASNKILLDQAPFEKYLIYSSLIAAGGALLASAAHNLYKSARKDE